MNSSGPQGYPFVAMWPYSFCSQRMVCALVHLFATPWTVAHQVPLSMEFPRQKCWSGLPFPSPGDLSNPGIETASFVSPALAGRYFAISTIWHAPNLSMYVCVLRLFVTPWSVACQAPLSNEVQFSTLCEVFLNSNFPVGYILYNTVYKDSFMQST